MFEVKDELRHSALTLDNVLNPEDLQADKETTHIKCKSCNSTLSCLSIICPNCRGADLVRGETTQHLSCLKFDLESNFKHQNGLTICHKCDRILTSLGCDYIKPGLFFKCQSCGEFTGRALKCFRCDKCNVSYELPEKITVDALQYNLERGNRDITARNFDGNQYPEVDQVLAICGLESKYDTTLKGISGVVHNFSFVSQFKEDHSSKSIVVIDVTQSNVKVDASAILSFFAKTLDCKVKNRFLIAVPGLDTDAKLLAERYKIQYVEGDSVRTATRFLQSILTQLVNLHLKISNKHPSFLEKARVSGRRGTLDIMTDILRIVDVPSSNAEIMACANMSYEQCQKYIPAMEKMGLLRRSIEDGVRVRYTISEKGREYLSNMSKYGRIGEGSKSVWTTRRNSGRVPIDA